MSPGLVEKNTCSSLGTGSVQTSDTCFGKAARLPGLGWGRCCCATSLCLNFPSCKMGLTPVLAWWCCGEDRRRGPGPGTFQESIHVDHARKPGGGGGSPAAVGRPPRYPSPPRYLPRLTSAKNTAPFLIPLQPSAWRGQSISSGYDLGRQLVTNFPRAAPARFFFFPCTWLAHLSS